MAILSKSVLGQFTLQGSQPVRLTLFYLKKKLEIKRFALITYICIT